VTEPHSSSVASSYIEHGVRTTFYGESGTTNYGGDRTAAVQAFKKPVIEGQTRELMSRQVWVGTWDVLALAQLSPPSSVDEGNTQSG
jgi:hypothetical protein